MEPCTNLSEKGNLKKAYGKNLYRNLSDDKVDDKSKTDLYFNKYGC